MSSPVTPTKKRFGPAMILIVTLVVAFVWGGVWAIITTAALDLDPWFGAHASLVCPRTCKGCTGPFHFLSFTSVGRQGGSSGNIVYCSHPNAKLDGPWATMMDNAGHNRPYEVPGGIWLIWLSSVLTWILPILAAVLLLRVRLRKRA